VGSPSPRQLRVPSLISAAQGDPTADPWLCGLNGKPSGSHVVMLTDAQDICQSMQAATESAGLFAMAALFPRQCHALQLRQPTLAHVANSLRFGSPLQAAIRSDGSACDRDNMVQVALRDDQTVQATRSFAGSAHSVQAREPPSPRRFILRQKLLVSVKDVQRAQSPNRKCSRCTNTLTIRPPAPECSDQSARDRSRQSRRVAPGR